jgi:hypothetical protein
MTATTTNRELWRETIRATLAQRGGDAPDASAVAEATASTWRQVAALLTPVIGARGVEVIFRRALSLTSKDFSWLALGEPQGDSAALLVSLQALLAGQEPDVAVEAACALLMTFFELLITLIGESLTEHLVSPVWVSPSSPSDQESET